MGFWGDAAAQGIGAFTGTVAGGGIAVLVARWQTNKSIDAQRTMAAEDRAAELARRREEREQEHHDQRLHQARNAAVSLLGRLEDLDSVLPVLPRLKMSPQSVSMYDTLEDTENREGCIEASASLRRA